MRWVIPDKGVFLLSLALGVLTLPLAASSVEPADQDKITTLELERTSAPPKLWPLPISRRVPVVEPLGEKIGQKAGYFPFKNQKPVPEFAPAAPTTSLKAGRVYPLQECLQIAIENHEGLRTARKQIELALSKLDESRRALFPNATLRSSLTKGETRSAPFREKEYIFRVEQPLFDGGGARSTLAQAQVNLEIARANYDKVMQDLRFEIEKNYYELAKLLMQLEIQTDAVRQSEPLVELTRRQLEVDVITRLEYLNVQALYQQLLYQQISTEKDTALGQMNLQHAMNVAAEPAIRIDYQLVSPEWSGKLQECQNLAMRRRPEILINYLLVKFHDYGRKIIEAKKRWKVDLASSYGSSGSAFQGEDLSLGDDLFVGLQVSRPMGLHSLTSSMTTQQTAAKLGQSDRTESDAFSTEIGFFNQYGGISERKEADVSYYQAVGELDKIKKTVESEVSEAYFNGQKAEVLYNAQKNRVEFRERGLGVVELQQKINEALISNVLEAQIQLTQERIALVSALADYHLALANLNRTTGYAI